ncbi:MAG TPA: efflux RND transporter periplasmic adaptor subunit [Caulobacteraceae bacterium]|jgi:RND family efflux transporter MFP subunit|nr:efflux RND transporter periplasmic adaptor subunit [Caulobacteraceae bacterium]
MPTETETPRSPDTLPDEMRHRPQPWLKPALLIGAGVAILIVVTGLLGRVFASQGVKTWTNTEAVPIVQVIHPALDGGGQSLVLPGDVQAFYNASIHARVSGYLKHWYLDIGAPVKAGQLLADIDTPELDQQLAQAKAALATAAANQRLAQTTATRWTALLAKDAVSQQETDEKTGDLAAKTSLVSAARADVDRLQALEGFKRIVAPFNGVVTARNTDIGQLIAAGAPTDPGLFTVSDIHRLRIYVNVPQSYSAELKPGTTATLTVPEYPGQTFKAALVSTSNAVSTQSGTLLAELQIDNASGQLKPGDYAQVSFALPASTTSVRVPASALMFRQKGLAVATVGPDGRVVMKYVTIGVDQGAFVDLATGLAPSDRVIDNPPDSIETGDRVRVASATAPGAGAARGS